MQKALRVELEAQISSPIAKHDRWSESSPDTHILNRFADVVMENLRQKSRHINPDTFDAVIQLLSDQGVLSEEHEADTTRVLSEELAVDMISLAFIVELIMLFSGFPGVAVFVRLK